MTRRGEPLAPSLLIERYLDRKVLIPHWQKAMESRGSDGLCCRCQRNLLWSFIYLLEEEMWSTALVACLLRKENDDFKQMKTKLPTIHPDSKNSLTLFLTRERTELLHFSWSCFMYWSRGGSSDSSRSRTSN